MDAVAAEGAAQPGVPRPEVAPAPLRAAPDLGDDVRSSLTVVMNNLFLAQARLNVARSGLPGTSLHEAEAFLREALVGVERLRGLARRR